MVRLVFAVRLYGCRIATAWCCGRASTVGLRQPTKRRSAGFGMLRGLSNEQPTTTAARHPLSPRPPACRSRYAAQPRDSPRARCCYTSSVLYHTSSGPTLKQCDATILGYWLEEEQDKGTSCRHPFALHALTYRQAPAGISASPALAKTAAVVVHGLKVVTEGTNLTTKYASCCFFARS